MLLLLLGACHHLGTLPDGAGDDTPPIERIAVTPDHLDFPTVSVNHEGSATLSFSVSNLGDGAVTVTGHDEVGGAAPFRVDAVPLLVVEAGDTVELSVHFEPATDGAWSADLVVEPGAEHVHLEGVATAPVVHLGEVDVDPVVLGCTGVGTVVVENRGTETLALESAHLLAPEFAVVGLPAEVPPGGSGAVDVTFTPQAGGSLTTSLVVASNDPATPEVAIPVSALGYEGERVTESFRYAPTNPTDILFVVDTGASMSPLLQAAAPAIDAFVDAIRSTNVDYHLAALGSEDTCPGTTPGFATRTDTALQTEVVLERGFLAGSGAWEDDLLGLALAGLDASGVGGCLEGFRRNEADLHVIAVTDGPASPTLEDQVNALAARVEGDARFRLSALLPLGGCGADADRWADEVDTTGGSSGDVCGPDWVGAFEGFAELPPGAEAVSYPLAEWPVATSVRVTVEGLEFEAWRYDEAENLVVFDGDAVPALGAEVVIEYVLAVACAG